MADSANALQKGIYAALSGDTALTALIGADGVFDRRDTARPMPYLAIAEIDTRDFGPDTEEHFVTIEAWSDVGGRRQVQAIAARARDVLHDAPLSLTGAALVNLQHRTTRIRREPKTKAFVAEMTFRAVTE